ncbi:glycerol-3-phosphate acyltransferase [uncultured Faecalibaculum sp.]|uniref:glycerol-3-phosphate acyltransferase n=1 Tax=uncultured Faecalibaculum sp. TaxID=1729681 RepID=UPI0025FBE78B|nr:glycerol-3-phosphate acyltransferase [uncultured Faecalibaculum sp.]
MEYRLLSLFIGYLCGCVLFSPIVARARGKNIYEEGSGNPGMANTGRVLGKGAAALVLLGDGLKTVLAIVICRLLFPAAGSILTLYAGLGAALGHCYPFWRHFQGGKGVAVLAVTYVLYAPLYGIISLLAGGLCVLCRMGLKWGAAIISLAFSVCLGLAGSREAFFVSLAMAALMIARNSRKTLLDAKSKESRSADESAAE